MDRCPTRMGAWVERGAMPEQGYRASHARPFDCVVAGAVRKGAQRRRDARAAVLVENATEVFPWRANDVRLLSSKVSVYAWAGVDASAGVDADVDVGADADADAGVGVGVGVGEHGCEDARGRGHGYGYGDVGSLLRFEVAVEVALVGREEDDLDDGCVHAGVGAGENEGEGTDFHEGVHTTVAREGGVHQDQDAAALVPK